MPGSLLYAAVGAVLLSPNFAPSTAAALKSAPPDLDMVRVKTLTGYALPPLAAYVAITPTSFAQEILNVSPSATVQPALPIEQKVFGGAEEPGIVFVIGGLGGGDSLATHTRRAFECSCVPHEVCSFSWCHGKRHHFQDLFDHGNVDCQSEQLAGQIMEYRRLNPTKPIYIMAWSAGVGVALGAGERLPPDSIDRIVIMCAACSRCYNLSGALRSTRCGIVSFHSPMDHFYLNAVLRCLGTIDRVHGMGAGVTGFTVPCCLSCEDQELYNRRLIQVAWRPHMIFDGHPGGHLWYKSDRFLCAHVVPWLRACPSDIIPVQISTPHIIGAPQMVVPSGELPPPTPTTSTPQMPVRSSETPTPAELAIQGGSTVIR